MLNLNQRDHFKTEEYELLIIDVYVHPSNFPAQK